ncbi:hypothetical protein FGG08_003648 [Glutinoglossum americanum]|uniref:Uncharacterized protein n=1 Tax=Glutinoglossum americanum TaxID=1670608 RepID=A0A9P8L4L1_9PEZI|nr:hypothetical protein FGG08_003648 [Glutinoglossum americanum]
MVFCVLAESVLFEEQCGATSIGLSPQTQQNDMHEDLVALFSRNLTLSNQAQVIPATQADSPQPQPAIDPQAVEKPKYSISQHYHHSAHLASSAPPSTAPSPALGEQTTDVVTAEIILSRNGVDPTTLIPSQLMLFREADVSQKMRLVELWRISPPNASAHELGNWSQTNLQQGENMATVDSKGDREEQEKLGILMHEQQLDQPNNVWAEQGQSSNQSLGVVPISGGDSRDIDCGHQQDNAEPYILSGYESLAKRDYEAQAQMDTESHIVKSTYQPLGSAVGGDWTPEMQLFQENQRYTRATDPVYTGLDYWSLYHAKPLPDLPPIRSEVPDDSYLADAQLKAIMGQQRMEHQYGALEELNRFRSPVMVGADEEML